MIAILSSSLADLLTGIYPEILEPILSSSFSTEADFGIARLALPTTSHQLVICNFFGIGPGIREYGIGRKVIGTKGDQVKVVTRLGS